MRYGKQHFARIARHMHHSLYMVQGLISYWPGITFVARFPAPLQPLSFSSLAYSLKLDWQGLRPAHRPFHLTYI